MRIGVVSDVHANLAALRQIDHNGCDVIVSLDDTITIGPSPAETVSCLRGHEVPSIAGNPEDDLVPGFGPRDGAANGLRWAGTLPVDL